MKKHMLTLMGLMTLCAHSAMADSLTDSMAISASGMRAQSERMKIVSQNIANADSTGLTPGAEPYRRKTIFFKNAFDPKAGTQVVKVAKMSEDYQAPFEARFDPSHPAANADGYVLLPNVKRSIEVLDMKEAERSYEANLGAIETSKAMIQGTIDLLR